MSTRTATAAAKITYRKTGKGEWVAYGPASAIIAGQYAEITTRSGRVDRMMISRTGRTFRVGGTEMVYGYLGSGATISQGTGGSQMCDACGERRAVATARDLSGFTGRVCGQCKREEGSLSFA